MDDPIRDELHKLSEEFRKLAELTTSDIEETKPERLTQFGLTLEEAKAWLKNEPRFKPSADSYHDKDSDDKLPEPPARRTDYLFSVADHFNHRR